MPRTASFVSCLSLLLLCWLGMQIVHELGHAVGALLTGGRVNTVFLHPLAISRTDVHPNPAPGIVVWMGPLGGCCLPLFALMLCRRLQKRHVATRANSICPRICGLVGFFAGFCLISNGAYLAFGTHDRVGDCGEMLRTGTPAWIICGTGIAMTVAGFYSWHHLGSLPRWFSSQDRSWNEAAMTSATLPLVVAVELWLTS
jgi:hypothetical protein